MRVHVEREHAVGGQDRQPASRPCSSSPLLSAGQEASMCTAMSRRAQRTFRGALDNGLNLDSS